MTYEQFWNDCPELYFTYQEAYVEKLREKDLLQWQLGVYIQHAIASCLDKNAKYPRKQLFFNKDERPKNAKEMRDKAMSIVAILNATNKH